MRGSTLSSDMPILRLPGKFGMQELAAEVRVGTIGSHRVTKVWRQTLTALIRDQAIALNREKENLIKRCVPNYKPL